MTEKMIKEALDGGVPALKTLFEKLPKEEALKGIGILVILGIAYKTIDVIKDIVTSK